MGEVILSAKQIKAEALRLGFSACGVAPATKPFPMPFATAIRTACKQE